MDKLVSCPNCDNITTIHSSDMQWKCPNCKSWIKVENIARPIRSSCECCYDCIVCIRSNTPLEAGLRYTCINPKGINHFKNQWGNACMHFMKDL